MIEWLLEFIGLKRDIVEHSRSELIRMRYAAGEKLFDLAGIFGISPQRIYQIVHGKQH
ncbi:MAG: hypothetical protein K8L97_17395 [Anaerolineae bacterium]|nr:hypothetical protein [Anaerolineae bacterium]